MYSLLRSLLLKTRILHENICLHFYSLTHLPPCIRHQRFGLMIRFHSTKVTYIHSYFKIGLGEWIFQKRHWFHILSNDTWGCYFFAFWKIILHNKTHKWNYYWFLRKRIQPFNTRLLNVKNIFAYFPFSVYNIHRSWAFLWIQLKLSSMMHVSACNVKSYRGPQNVSFPQISWKIYLLLVLYLSLKHEYRLFSRSWIYFSKCM